MKSTGFLIHQHELVEDMLRPDEGDIDLISLPVFVLSNLASGVTSVIPEGDLRRPGELEELDGAMLLLASRAGSYITGQTIPVDGGWTIR